MRIDLRPLRQVVLSILCLIVCFIVIRMVSDAHRSREKERLIRSMVRHHQLSLAQNRISGLGVAAQKSWPNEFPMLESWLVSHLAAGTAPGRIRTELDSMRRLQGGRLPEGMQITLSRWDDALRRWEAETHQPRPTTAADALQRGRTRYLEAKGLSAIGRSYDATVLFLWAREWVDRSIDLEGAAQHLPETLYLLGEIFVTLRRSMPKQFHGDQLLNVCSDLFPSSIWASRANAVWQTSMIEPGGSR
jgi:hypothetical protein